MTGNDEQPEDFKTDKQGAQQRWKREYDAAVKALEPSRNSGAKVEAVFLDEREAGKESETRWNLFHANIQQQLAVLYGNVPKANVSRRYADAQDDVARISAEMAERHLHTDIEKRSDTAAEAFGNALIDWRVPGCGQVRVRYHLEEETVEAQPAQVKDGVEVPDTAVPEHTKRKHEDAFIDYVHWRDYLWSPCRVWSELTWMGYAAEMAKAPFIKRFGKEAWEGVPKMSKAQTDDEREKDPWARVRVWEFWHKDEGRVYWYVDGYREILDIQDDPLELEGFWPSPRFLISNALTSKLLPRPDYVMAQDLYLEINSVSTRIDLLQRAIKACGLYDKGSPEVQSLLEEATQNRMLPAENWPLFAERGGLQGAMQFLPLDIFSQALAALRDYRRELVDALYQVTAQSDIMRGQATQSGATAHEQSIKAKFGSVRLQRLQDEFARFVSDALALKLEVICKHFLPQTILERSNAQFAFAEEEKANPGIVQRAVDLLQSDYSCYRVEVKPESISLTDFAQLKNDKTELIGAVSQFLTAAAPMAQGVPGSMPYLLQMLQNLVAGLRGSSTMEGILDAAIKSAEKAKEAAAANPQQAQPDPAMETQRMKMQGDQMKAQADMQKEQYKHQADLERIAAETQAHDQQEQSQARWNTQEAVDKQLATNALKPPPPPPGMGVGP
jgi:hypothetical protein